MSILEKASSLLGDESDGTRFSLWQIIGPLFVLCAAFLAPRDPLILAVSVAGLLFAARWQIRGFSYALVLLGCAAIVEHLFLTQDHLWQLGLEGAYTIAFFITALSSEQQIKAAQSFAGLIGARNASISNLEEEAIKTRELAISQQMALQVKIDALQKELEELHSEHATFLILNEVLRKTTAAHLEERDQAKQQLFDAQGQLSFLQGEREELERQVARFSNENSLVIENRHLFDELNASRLEREQAHLISEALSREYAKESLKAREASLRVADLEKENQKLTHEANALSTHLEQIGLARDRYHTGMKRLEEVQQENHYLRERLAKAELEMSQKGPSAASSEELLYLQGRVQSLNRFERLYQQLKTQFEERNQVLHQVRTELFRTDTELQALKIEKEQREINCDPISGQMEREIASLEAELSALEEENQELQSLITILNENPPEDATRRKKKLKTDPDQSLLF